MSSLRKGELNPRSTIHPQFGRIKKVFLAYAHNPDPYEQYIPPYPPEQLLNPDFFEFVCSQQKEHAYVQQRKKQSHERTVKSFVDCLKVNGVAVYCDQDIVRDASNILNHFERQIQDSDVVLVIITHSLKYYMDNDAPSNEGEILLTRDFLYNLMTIKKPEGTQFIPIFLNQPTKRELIPTTIAGTVCYSINEPFDCRLGDMQSLYAFLTNQKMADISHHPCNVIKVPTRRPPFGHGFSPVFRVEGLTSHQQQIYNLLSMQHTPVSEDLLVRLSNELAPHLKKLTDKLGLNTREIQECVAIGESDDREIVYQVLRYWQQKSQQSATVAVLARVLRDIHCSHMLYILQ